MKQDIKPTVIAFEVTRRCRFHCPHCRAGAGIDPSEEILTTGQCKNIIDAIASYSKCTLIVTGGEPMERSDIYELISYGDNAGLKVVMATCGYLIDAEAIRKLKKAGVQALSVSIDGSSAESCDALKDTPGAFDAAVNAAKIAKKGRMRFQINMAISKANVDEVAGVYELAKRLGAYCFNPFVLVPTGSAKELKDEVIDPIDYEMLMNEFLEIKLEKDMELRVTCGPQFARVSRQQQMERLGIDVKGCMGAREFGFISYRGDVQICGFLDVSAGNLLENGYNFAKIWNESELLEKVRSQEFSGACGNCGYMTVCGGCRARAYSTAGDYMASDPVCGHKSV